MPSFTTEDFHETVSKVGVTWRTKKGGIEFVLATDLTARAKHSLVGWGRGVYRDAAQFPISVSFSPPPPELTGVN